MEFGLGLPISDPARLPEWARLAEEHRFATVALLDRLAYDNPEPLTALAVLAGATTRIRLQTEVLLGPLRSTALLAKQVATLDRMSAGRFVLGIGIGGREDDHVAAGVPLNRRGRLLDTQLADLRSIWRGDPYRATQPIGDGGKRGWGLGPTESGAAAAIGPRPVTAGGPPILIGGFAPEALRRVAQFADGFICAAPLTWAGGLVRTVNEQWEQAGRAGRPRLVCQINTAVGSPGTVERARRAVAAYYAFTGRPGWGAPLSDPARIAETVAAYREFGADELIFYCYGDDPRQVELLAGIVSG
jgi:alkanesulfonate monooxygenase SsuD/methylene tetrahydromethanopterin reductase-like flavin-dependent oxidoreductase (luciferase family)